MSERMMDKIEKTLLSTLSERNELAVEQNKQLEYIVAALKDLIELNKESKTKAARKK